MKTITLEDGRKIKISDESYAAMSKAADVTYHDIAEFLSDYGITKKMMGLKFFSIQQVEKLRATHKLMNTARYLNEGWVPDWLDENQFKYSIYIDHRVNSIKVGRNSTSSMDHMYFRSDELAKRAIKILGEDTIRTALGTDW